MIDRRTSGAEAERLAAEYLIAQGLEIVLRNYRRRTGELDLVAREGEVLVIVEVRMRSSGGHTAARRRVSMG